MIGKRILFSLFALSLLTSWTPLDQDEVSLCGLRNTTFAAGENISFNIYYSVIGIYVNAGSANVATTVENLDGTSVYHVVGNGRSNSSYDWIFKVRDRYESYFDTMTMLPLRFVRDVHEGKYTKNQTLYFNHHTHKAVTEKGTFNIPACTQDVISGVYNIRNIDFGKYKINEKIPFDMFLDDDLYHMYVRYQGKEVVKTRLGKFNAIKTSLLLIKGNIFKGGEGMTVWISDDGNRIPLRIESSLSVGSIKVDMMQAQGLRHPFSSRL